MQTGSLRLLVIPAVVAVSACGSSTLSAPRLLELVSPREGMGYLGEDNVLVIDGEGLSDAIVPNAGNPGESKVTGIRISLTGTDGKEIGLIDPTFVSTTRFQATLPTNLSPGFFDVSLLMDDKIEGTLPPFQMGWKATTFMVLTTEQEPAPGVANHVTMDLRLHAANGELGIRREELILTPVFGGSFVTSDLAQQSLIVPPGDTFEDLRVNLIDTAAELVTITFDPMPGDMEQPAGALNVTFVPGPPVQARLLPAIEINATDNFVDTFFQVEDQWANPSMQHAEYNASFSFGLCLTASANPDPVVVPSNAGIVPVRIFCPIGMDTFVTFTENTATGYDNGGLTVIDFN